MILILSELTMNECNQLLIHLLVNQFCVTLSYVTKKGAQ